MSKLQIHWDYDVTGYPVFYVHGLSGPQKRDAKALNSLASQFEASEVLSDRIRELEQELTNANTDWHESETARVHAERLLRELIDIEGPQPGHVEWYRRVRALLGMTETETKGEPNLLKPITTEWDTDKNDNAITVHHRMVDGVLCRWWGDGPTPGGVALIDRAIETKAEYGDVVNPRGCHEGSRPPTPPDISARCSNMGHKRYNMLDCEECAHGT